MIRLSRSAERGVFVAMLLSLVVGLGVVSSGLLSPEEKEDEPPSINARPDERNALGLAEARYVLNSEADIAAVIEVVEAGDTEAFLRLIRHADYCTQSFRETPQLCAGGNPVEGVYQQQSTLMRPDLRPLTSVEGWLTEFFEGGPAVLEFASRDSRLPKGAGGEYFLVFRMAAAIEFADYPGFFDKIGVRVRPGEESPVWAFTFGTSTSNPLRWIQELGGGDGAKYHELITPETVADLPGRFGR